MLLDSNILIYAVEPEGAFLSKWVEDAAACIATVSRIEVLDAEAAGFGCSTRGPASARNRTVRCASPADLRLRPVRTTMSGCGASSTT